MLGGNRCGAESDLGPIRELLSRHPGQQVPVLGKQPAPLRFRHRVTTKGLFAGKSRVLKSCLCRRQGFQHSTAHRRGNILCDSHQKAQAILGILKLYLIDKPRPLKIWICAKHPRQRFSQTDFKMRLHERMEHEGGRVCALCAQMRNPRVAKTG